MKYLLRILPSVIIIIFFYTFAPSHFNLNARKNIKILRAQNDSLSKANDSIFKEIKLYEQDMASQDEIIRSLFEETKMQQEELNKLKKDIKTIQGKYEKAKNHSNNFSSGDITRYFSEL